MSEKRFLFLILFIAAAGALLRFVNITFASLWADELYSMLSVHPGNSWYLILYMQRTYQPPGYFMLLWEWTKLFGYTEWSARLLSIVGGVLAIVLSGYLGKKIKDNRLGMLLALLVAFNPTQIFYSLEARFYIFAFCLAVVSLWLYWHLLFKRNSNLILYIFLAAVNAVLCYFHHFGIFFVFALFLYDLKLFYHERDKFYFFRKILVYVVTAILYSPWFFWGLLQGMATTNFWLKEINVWQYITFGFGYAAVINIALCILIAYYVYLAVINKKQPHGSLFPLIVLCVIVFPLLYSYLRVPILVDRYSMVMVPALYIMIGWAALELYSELSIGRIRKAILFASIVIIVLPGLYLSFFHKENLQKQPWREMAAWLKKQPDYKQTNVYSLGILLNDRFTIDFYLEPEKKAIHASDMIVGHDEKMYVVESNFVWSVSQELLNKIKSSYNINIVPFCNGEDNYGNIYVCSKKDLAISYPQNTIHAY